MGRAAKIHLLTERTCRKCDETKPVAEMISDKGKPTTLCRECNKMVASKRYEANKEDHKAKVRALRKKQKKSDPAGVSKRDHDRYWEKKKKDPIGYVLARLKRAAKAKGLAFDLKRADIFIPKHCPVLGIKLNPIASGRGDGCPEVDRLVPELGYVRGNISIISHRANRIKDNGTALEHERIAAWMRAQGEDNGR